MPQVGADGDVVDITLHTVKVQNHPYVNPKILNLFVNEKKPHRLKPAVTERAHQSPLRPSNTAMHGC
jgi:hypothetical protein